MRTPGRLGALAPVRPHGLRELSVYARPLPPPRERVAVPAVADWGMLGNDSYGDCTIAGAGHLLIAANAEVGTHDPVPSSTEVVGQYLSITGGEDRGCVEADVLAIWRHYGLFGGNRIDAYAPVDHRKVLDLHQAVAAYGAAYLGVALPASAQQQFAHEQPWTYRGDRPVGGHCIVAVGYDPSGLHCVTWGAVVQVTYPWLAAYCTEAWAVIPQAFVESGYGPEIDLASLQADLSQI